MYYKITKLQKIWGGGDGVQIRCSVRGKMGHSGKTAGMANLAKEGARFVLTFICASKMPNS